MKHAEAFSHADKETYVVTRKAREKEGNRTFYNGELRELVKKLKSTEGKNIFCDGGAEIVNELLKEKLIDELIVSIIPVLLGEGVRLFKDGTPEQELKLVSAKNYETGLVQLHYNFEKKV
jgi:dihydrofolate reductase